MTDPLTCLERMQSLVRKRPVDTDITVNAVLPYITRCYESMSERHEPTMNISIEDILLSLNAQSTSRKYVCDNIPAFSRALSVFLRQADIPVDVWEISGVVYDCDPDIRTDGSFGYGRTKTSRVNGVTLNLYR